MRHLDGTEVHPQEMERRVLADELMWVGQLLQHDSGKSPEADRVLNVADDALHYGQHSRLRPHWQAVADFEQKHRRELETILGMDIARPLIDGFRARFQWLFALAEELDTTEPVEQFEEEFQRYMLEIAQMIHELKYLVSERRPAEMTLQEAQELADSHVVARAWDAKHQLTLVKQATTLPVVGPDGSFGAERSRPAVLEMGREPSSGKRARGFRFLPGYLRRAG